MIVLDFQKSIFAASIMKTLLSKVTMFDMEYLERRLILHPICCHCCLRPQTSENSLYVPATALSRLDDDIVLFSYDGCFTVLAASHPFILQLVLVRCYC